MATKKANGEGNVRKKKSGLWEGRVVTGRDKDGKLIRKSVYAPTKERSDKRVHE